MENVKKNKNVSECYGSECNQCATPCELHDCGMDVIREKIEDKTRNYFKRELHYNDQVLPPEIVSTSNSTNSDVLDILNRLAFFYIEYPATFHALICKFYKRQNQADIAREQKISRQAVSKRLRRESIEIISRELGMRTPVVRQEKLLGLTGREFEVYKKLFVDGCTERSTAIQLGIPKSTVHDIGQILRRKLAKNRARKKPVQKKS